MAIYMNDIVDINLESGSIHRSFLNHTIGSGDNSANRFGVRTFRNGVAEDLSGCSCQAVFMNAAGTNIALTSYGTVSGNEAYVTLPQACYNVEGQFCLAIKLIKSGVTVTSRIVDGVVCNTGTTGAVAPTSSVPTYQEILSVYDDMVAATSAANLAIAEEFDASENYPAGKNVINDGALYILPNGHTAGTTWANTTKVASNLGDQVTDLKSAFNNIPDVILPYQTFAGYLLNLSGSITSYGGYTVGVVKMKKGRKYRVVKLPGSTNRLGFSNTLFAGSGQLTVNVKNVSDSNIIEFYNTDYDYLYYNAKSISDGYECYVYEVASDSADYIKMETEESNNALGIVSGWRQGKYDSHGLYYMDSVITSEVFFVGAGKQIYYNFASSDDYAYRLIFSTAETETGAEYAAMTDQLTGQGVYTMSVDRYVHVHIGSKTTPQKKINPDYGYKNAFVSTTEVENPAALIQKIMGEDEYKLKIINGNSIAESLNRVAGDLPRNTYCWVNSSWFDDLPEGLQWIFTFSWFENDGSSYAGQLSYMPSNGKMYVRQRVSALHFDWTEWICINESGQEQNQWNGKKWFAYGTSLTTEAQGHWVNTTAIALGLVASNKGIGGGALVANRNIYNAVMDLTDGKTDADLITFEFGANDRSSPLGTIDSLDNTTILGAANLCIKQLAENCPKAQIVIMPSIPNRYEHQHPDQEHTLNYANPGGWTQDEFYESVRKLAQLNCVHYCPFGSQFAIPFFRSHMKTNGSFDNTYIADQIHPTELGGYNIAQEMIKYLKTIPAWYTSIPT